MKWVDLPRKDLYRGFFEGFSSPGIVPSFFGVMSMASGSCRPFLKLRTVSPNPRLIWEILLPPERKKTIARMMISSPHPKLNRTNPPLNARRLSPSPYGLGKMILTPDKSFTQFIPYFPLQFIRNLKDVPFLRYPDWINASFFFDLGFCRAGRPHFFA